MKQQRYREVVVGYLTDTAVSPAPIRRCALAWPDGADAVFAAVTRRRGFSWARHGEDLLRQHKPAHLDRPLRPSFSVLGSLLGEQVKTASETETATQPGGTR